MRTPDLGKDEDVKFALASIDESQKESGKQLHGVVFGQKPVQYAESKGLDQDITDSASSINLAEKKLNQKLSTEYAQNNNIEYNQKW